MSKNAKGLTLQSKATKAIRKTKQSSILASSLSPKLDASTKNLPKINEISLSPYAIKLRTNIKLSNFLNNQKMLSKKLTRETSDIDQSSPSLLPNKTEFCMTPILDLSSIEDKNNLYNKGKEMFEALVKTKGSKNHFENCRKSLENIIQNEKNFSEPLKIIKEEYEKIIKAQKEKIEEKNRKIENLEKSEKCFAHEIEKLVLENRRVMYSNEKYKSKYIKANKKFDRIIEDEDLDLEMTDMNWRKVIKENLYLKEMLNGTKIELVYYRKKARKVNILLNTLENHGFDVEYLRNIVKEKTDKQVPNCQEKDETYENTENENILSSYRNEKIPIHDVPRLNLSGICKYNEESGYNLDESSSFNIF
ncbi:hypothetical protein SteCoe_16904 [Stentor coeruleus]|uniref:Translin-associated factor X-interacting protein 1 N-terminal domain-containing protein n=1 Tax=Stentor coeruleus TaxID=5963 RepID=A0A1R2C0C2_9CILI|nr:hypothetical protein SteCoe_16904 [Stentor coeruleus]